MKNGKNLKKTKRFLAAFAAVVLLCCAVFAVPAFPAEAKAAEPEFDVAVTADKGNLKRGDTVSITVSVRNITASGGLLSVDIPFRLDTETFDFVSKEAHFPSVWTKPSDFSYKKPNNGLLYLRMLDEGENYSSTAGCREDDKIQFTVKLRVIGSAPSGKAEISVSGKGPFEDISGTCADGQCTLALGSGSPLFLSVEGQAFQMGDLNGDGFVDNVDASILLRYDAGSYQLDDRQREVADINGDGTLDNMDAALILKYDSGEISGF